MVRSSYDFIPHIVGKIARKINTYNAQVKFYSRMFTSSIRAEGTVTCVVFEFVRDWEFTFGKRYSALKLLVSSNLKWVLCLII